VTAILRDRTCMHKGVRGIVGLLAATTGDYVLVVRAALTLDFRDRSPRPAARTDDANDRRATGDRL
jgi:hypothetical protein